MKKISVGRYPENDLVLKEDKLVSGKHLLLSMDETGAFFVEDLNSTNGTYVNERKIEAQKPFVLQINDQIRIGASRLPWQNCFEAELKTLHKTLIDAGIRSQMPVFEKPEPHKKSDKENQADKFLVYIFAALVLLCFLLLFIAYIQ